MSTAQQAVKAEDLTKFYGSRRGLEGMTLHVEVGEVFGYLGPNGAGKTTTIRLLLDLIRSSRGRIEVLGMEPRKHQAEIRAASATYRANSSSTAASELTR